MTESIRTLLQKVKELANRGIGGEREAAEAKLKALLKRHGLTLDDLNEEKTGLYSFSVANKTERGLLGHVAMGVLGTRKIRHWNHSRSVEFELTQIQAADLRDAWAH